MGTKKNEKKFANTYLFIAMVENLPSIKLESDDLIKAGAFFIQHFIQMEKDFDVQERETEDGMGLIAYPNDDLCQKLGLTRNKQCHFIVIEESKFKKISPDLWKHYNY